ncbi:MAG TPA: glycosyl transferase family 2 [Opitutus sp.]|nr:glycosyl transferase family 2 [Opitutus sp.]
MSWRNTAHNLRLGRAAYLLWHAPAGFVRDSIAAGGPLAQWRDLRGMRAMAQAAPFLPASSLPGDPALPELHFLTGKRFWYQTAFCLHTLQSQAQRTFRTVLHDDGSFDETIVAHLARLFPTAEIRRRADTDARISALLPPAQFPCLHERRRHYPNILKLTDVHAGARGWRLVLDSDMLFFRRPDFLLAWLAAPDRPLHMVDVIDSYGYPNALLESLAGATLPHLVNVGLTGLCSETIDWEKLERWSRRLIETHGTSYYLEQALVAMLLAGRETAVAPAADYILAPDIRECRAPRAVLHHYVGGSKRGYFRHAWRAALSRPASSA